MVTEKIEENNEVWSLFLLGLKIIEKLRLKIFFFFFSIFLDVLRDEDVLFDVLFIGSSFIFDPIYYLIH